MHEGDQNKLGLHTPSGRLTKLIRGTEKWDLKPGQMEPFQQVSRYLVIKEVANVAEIASHSHATVTAVLSNL